jgi:hypothetical protein
MSPKLFPDPGTDVMIFQIFSPKNSAKKLAFWTKTKLNYEKNDNNIVFDNNAIFSPKIGENRRTLRT